jgi:hypothetical protein
MLFESGRRASSRGAKFAKGETLSIGAEVLNRSAKVQEKSGKTCPYPLDSD